MPPSSLWLLLRILHTALCTDWWITYITKGWSPPTTICSPLKRVSIRYLQSFKDAAMSLAAVQICCDFMYIHSRHLFYMHYVCLTPIANAWCTTADCVLLLMAHIPGHSTQAILHTAYALLPRGTNVIRASAQGHSGRPCSCRPFCAEALQAFLLATLTLNGHHY